MSTRFNRPDGVFTGENRDLTNRERFTHIQAAKTPIPGDLLDADLNKLYDAVNLLNDGISSATAGVVPGATDIINKDKMLSTNGVITGWKFVEGVNIKEGSISLDKLAIGTAGQLITWGANQKATTVGHGSQGEVLTANAVGLPPTFEPLKGVQAAPDSGIVVSEVGGNWQVEGNIAGLTSDNAPDINADLMAFHDTSASSPNLRKIIVGELLKLLPISANSLKVKQILTQTSNAATSTTAVIPADTSIPQNTEGTELITATITPTSETSKLMIEFHCPLVSRSAAGVLGVFALFKDASPNALDVSTTTVDSVTRSQSVFLRHVVDAGSISAVTFKIRYGAGQAATLSVLKTQDGTVTFGGVPQMSLTITEFI